MIPETNEPSGQPQHDPSVAVLVPVRNERRFIESCVRALLDQSDPPSGYEVVVVDGMSDDGTREIVARLAAEEPRLRMLDNPRRIVSTALNIGIRATRSDVVIRVDGHARVAPDFVRRNLDLLREHPEAWSVGGPAVHRGENAVARGIAIAMTSRFGAGGATFRRENYEGYTEGAVFPLYRREIFDKLGLFDEDLVRNQDDEFNFRMTESGGKVWVSPRVRYEYYVRGSLRHVFRQYQQYAYWKVEVMRKHRKVVKLRHLVPAAFLLGVAVCALLAALASPPLSLAAAGLLAVYGALLIGFAAAAAVKSKSLPVGIYASAAAVTLHVAYGLGTIIGLVAPPGSAGATRDRMERISR